MKRPALLAMIFVMLVAAALRWAALPALPLGLHYDEAANVILARQIAAGTYRPIFIRAYTGKDVLFFYAAAPWLWMTGGAPWGLRLGAAVLGLLTVAATFAATRALLRPCPRSRAVAVLAAGWVAVAFPHVLLSRYGFRAIAQPLLQALTVAALWRGMRRDARGWLVAGGALLGLTAYTYLAARLFPVPLALAWGCALLRTPRIARRRRLGQMTLALLAAAVALAPLALFFLRNPGTFGTRIEQVAARSWRDAARGLWRCLRALAWPGTGDAYVRFNAPGRPVMDPLSALLALVGLAQLLRAPRQDALERAGRVFVGAVLLTMLLPSALATGEITPSNLRLVGLFPFLGVLPAWGAVTVWARVRRRVRAVREGRAVVWAAAGLVGLLALGAVSAGAAYVRWANSTALFYAADGEMALAARALDALAGSGTVYVASEHYRHPTVAALAQAYGRAKWLTGASTLVLPPEGDAHYLVPRSQPPPAPWPAAVTRAWETTVWPDPGGASALDVHTLPAEAIEALRPSLVAAEPADFAHVVWLHDARPLAACRVAARCPILLTWEARAPYPALEPVVRWLHPRTGEWARAMAFHYPPEQWALGDLVLDQVPLTPPVGTPPGAGPPGAGYRIGVGFFDPARGAALPRLAAERYAGQEARFPAQGDGLALAPLAEAPTPDQIAAACPGVPRREPVVVGALRLLGHALPAGDVLPGQRLDLRLCWQAVGVPDPAARRVTLSLVGPATYRLHAGVPPSGYGPGELPPGGVLEDRYAPRVPRDAVAGAYALRLAVGESAPVTLATVSIAAIERAFDAPAMAHRVNVDFAAPDAGALVRLLGYDGGFLRAGEPLTLTLHWRSLAEMDADYTVFVHLLDGAGQVVAQVDEGPARATSLWVAGEVVTDSHTLPVPEALARGSYRLRVGLYLQDTGDGLWVGNEKGVTLEELRVTP